MTMLISGGTHRWRLNNDVIDDATSDEEIGDEN